MAAAALPASPVRDPAWAGRLFWLAAALVVLWPLLVLSEFKPWVLLQPESLRPSLKFLGDFFPPKLDGSFLWAVAHETWRELVAPAVRDHRDDLRAELIQNNWPHLIARTIRAIDDNFHARQVEMFGKGGFDKFNIAPVSIIDSCIFAYLMIFWEIGVKY